MRVTVLMALTGIVLAGCATSSRHAGQSLSQALAGATLGQCNALTKDYGYGPRPPNSPPERWDGSRIACDANSRIGFVRTPEGRKLVVNAVPDAIPDQCWLKEVKSFRGPLLEMHFGTAWLDPSRNSHRNDQRGRLFDCGAIPWEESVQL